MHRIECPATASYALVPVEISRNVGCTLVKSQIVESRYAVGR